MRGAKLKAWSTAWLALALGACSSIIGISSYEIDPALDDAAAGSTSHAGTSSTDGGTAGDEAAGASGENSSTEGGDSNPDPSAGASPGGAPTVGGADAGGGAQSQGGESLVPSGCRVARDCDDDIDCTVDVCAADGSCTHEADDSVCDETRCERCQLGIGCVSAGTTTVALLTDGDFEQASSGWSQDSERENIVTSASAHSGTKVAQFGPGPSDTAASKQEYDDLYQLVSIPERAIAVTLTGYYKLAAGRHAPEENDVWAALYESDETYAALFFQLDGDLPEKTDWGVPFSYSLSEDELPQIAGRDFSFDLLATIWDGTYWFDSLQLTATVCE
jgi:hypothetical protein